MIQAWDPCVDAVVDPDAAATRPQSLPLPEALLSSAVPSFANPRVKSPPTPRSSIRPTRATFDCSLDQRIAAPTPSAGPSQVQAILEPRPCHDDHSLKRRQASSSAYSSPRRAMPTERYWWAARSHPGSSRPQAAASRRATRFGIDMTGRGRDILDQARAIEAPIPVQGLAFAHKKTPSPPGHAEREFRIPLIGVLRITSSARVLPALRPAQPSWCASQLS